MSVYRRTDRRDEWWVTFRYEGKRIHRRSPEQSEAGANAYEAELRRRLEAGIALEDGPAKPETPPVGASSTPLLRDFWPRFFKGYVEAQNRPSARRVKACAWRAHLNPALGHLRLGELTTARLDEFAADRLKAGLAPKSVNNHLSMLRCCLTVAQEWGEAGDPPSIRWQKLGEPDTEFLSPEESAALVAAAPHGLWKTMVFFLLNTGARFGEAAGLGWEDLDLDGSNPDVHIRHSATDGVFGPTKTRKSRRVPLTPELVQALRDWQHNRPFVFTRPNGKFLRSSNTLKYLHTFCADAGIRKVSWHQLRHTFASTLTAKGVPLRVVQELLGHSTIEMTQRYAHVSSTTMQDAVMLLSTTPQTPATIPERHPKDTPRNPQTVPQATPEPSETFRWSFRGSLGNISYTAQAS